MDPILNILPVTVAIPSIAPRRPKLLRAVSTVMGQSHPAMGVSIAYDLQREGAAHTRQRALDGVNTDWVAFLDDDDYFYPHHLQTLAQAAVENDADYVYSYYMVHGPDDRPLPHVDPLQHFGEVFNPEKPIQTTITTLVRTELAKSVGFRPVEDGKTIDGQHYGEDFQFTVECVAAGAKIVHTAKRSWCWSHDGKNTSGMPEDENGRPKW